jgi:alpha-L-fucosidase 2
MASTPAFLQQRLEFPFPAADPHEGIPLSNGTFGALVWGEGRCLRITINRADYWDHRGGLSFSEEATYENLKRWLAEGDEGRIRAVFEGRALGGDTPPRPTRLPMGRVDLQLPSGWIVESGGLHLLTGEAELDLGFRSQEARIRAVLLRESPVLCLRLTGLEGSTVQVLSRPPEAREVLERYQKYGLRRAQPFDLDEFGGWIQECPSEPAMCAAWLRHAANGGMLLFITSVFGETPVEARRLALQTLEGARSAGYTPCSLRTFSWWSKWWEQAAKVHLPDPTLELLYYLGMYKVGGISVPGSPAATLQGPWVEEDRMPPWSSDYHFNINVQECYWPCYAGNHLEALEPLVQMLESWEPKLRANARLFAGVRDGLQLPHSTDDRGTGMSGFWTGFVDHGSTAWTGQLLWLYYRYTLDRDFLRRTAYPFLKGAMRVYEAMLEDDGKSYSLPVGVSPEFGGAGFHAWGRNASFQLAVIHFLCRALCQTGEELGIDAEDRRKWRDIDARLPIGAVGEGPELLLWEGQPLTESHRHHSHLAAIYPFDVLDYHTSVSGEDSHARLVHNSMRRLTRMGSGLWTGWCVPWAAILHARLGHGDMAALLLESFRRVFMNPGYATTHDARFPGFTIMDSRPQIMQIEAGEGAAAAVLEMLLHTSGGALRVFPAVPGGWETARFEGIRAEGAFLVSAEWEAGRTRRVDIRSEAGAPLRLANPWGDEAVAVRREGAAPLHMRGRLLEVETALGETIRIEQS